MWWRFGVSVGFAAGCGGFESAETFLLVADSVGEGFDGGAEVSDLGGEAGEGARVVALTRYEVGQRVRATGLELTVLARQEARGALAHARVVVHLSDGARFPSFAIAALAAGVPTIARDTDINRELLDGAAALAPADDAVLSTIADAWSNESRRAIMVAAGRSRAVDYAPATAARAYVSLYRDVVRGWSS